MTRRRNHEVGNSSDESPDIDMRNTAESMSSIAESLQKLDESGPLPKLVAFDLDYTLWPLWVDTHVDTPIKRKGDAFNKAVDRYVIAAASRTSAPNAARQALQSLVLVDDSIPPTISPSTRQSKVITTRTPVKAISLFDQQEIYPGSKLTHFKALHAKTGIAYEEMLFFDDEHRNAEVGKLGVHFQLVGHSGTDLATFERGIREWRAKRKARQGDPDAGSELLK